MEKVQDERKHIIESDSEDQHFSFLAGKYVVGIKYCLCHSAMHMELLGIQHNTK